MRQMLQVMSAALEKCRAVADDADILRILGLGCTGKFTDVGDDQCRWVAGIAAITCKYAPRDMLLAIPACLPMRLCRINSAAVQGVALIVASP
jgi:hypothetical protein